jgi:hypothetical protein
MDGLLFAWSWSGWCQAERETMIRLCSWQGELSNAHPDLLVKFVYRAREAAGGVGLMHARVASVLRVVCLP